MPSGVSSLEGGINRQTTGRTGASVIRLYGELTFAVTEAVTEFNKLEDIQKLFLAKKENEQRLKSSKVCVQVKQVLGHHIHYL